ncbi:MAG: ubiquitin-like domain-containing protein [Anaerolineales bacterium]
MRMKTAGLTPGSAVPFLAGLTAILVGVGLFLATQRTVVVVAEGQTQNVHTHAQSVALVLRDAGLVLHPYDRVQPGLSSPVKSGMTIRVDRAKWIQLETGSGSTEILVHEGDRLIPANLLLSKGVSIFPGEVVLADGSVVDPSLPLPQVPAAIGVTAGTTFVLIHDGRIENLQAAGPTVGDALFQLGIPVYEGDSLDPPADTPLSPGPGQAPIRIVLKSSRQFQVRVDGKEVTIRSAANTVGEALAQNGLALSDEDYTLPAEDQPLPVDGQIRIVRVREALVRNQSSLPYGTSVEYLADLGLGQRQLVSPGKYGVEESVVRVRYEDGVEVKRTTEGQTILVQPTNEVVAYGTKIVIQSVSTPDGPRQYWYSVPVYATAYWPCGSAGAPGQCYPLTTSGKKVGLGMIAVVYSWYLEMEGWPVYVSGYGQASVEDYGENVTSVYWVDVAFPDYQTFLNHGGSGPKSTTLYFLTPVPSEQAIQFVARLPLR